MRVDRYLCLVSTLLLLLPCADLRAAEPVGGASAPRWQAQPAWITRKPQSFAVKTEGAAVAFHAAGAGTEMPFTLVLSEAETDGDARYLLVKYRAKGIDVGGGNYFIHGYEGTHGGIRFAGNDEAIADGGSHILVVDLEALHAQGPTTQVALKISVAAGGDATLWLDRLWFSDEKPASA
ncbi:MAG: hypothetical protein NTW19_11905, partial [Planctomycetota bacterium]|nr:hypothetical protein [Planctomycetota bacterium]